MRSGARAAAPSLKRIGLGEYDIVKTAKFRTLGSLKARVLKIQPTKYTDGERQMLADTLQSAEPKLSSRGARGWHQLLVDVVAVEQQVVQGQGAGAQRHVQARQIEPAPQQAPQVPLQQKLGHLLSRSAHTDLLHTWASMAEHLRVQF